MKKKLFTLFFLIILILISQVIINIFVKEKNINYKIGNYNIEEKLKVDKRVEYYDFIITDNNDKYIFGIDGKYKKKSKIIKEIRSFKEGKLKCIYPVFINDYSSDIVCRYDNNQVSYTYLKQVGNVEIEKIISKLKKEGINNSKWNDKSAKKEVLKYDSRKIDVYQDNLLTNYTYLMWGYRGLYILNKDKSVVKDYLDNDQYDNIHSALVGKYYITADSTEGRLKELICFDTETYKKKVISFKKATSIKYYFNGVIDDKLYITDVGLSKQYIVDPKKGKIEELDASKDKFVIFKNNKKYEVDSKKILKEEFYFSDTISNGKLEKLYPNINDIKEVLQYYYFKTSKGNIYRVNKDDLKSPELLFNFKDIDDWIIKDKDMMIIVNDEVYFYNDTEGLMLIAKNSELKYNYKNICSFWKA